MPLLRVHSVEASQTHWSAAGNRDITKLGFHCFYFIVMMEVSVYLVLYCLIYCEKALESSSSDREGGGGSLSTSPS